MKNSEVKTGMILKINDTNVAHNAEFLADVGMIGVVEDVKFDYSDDGDKDWDLIHVTMNFNDSRFIDHNKSLMKPTFWPDNDCDGMHTWFEDKFWWNLCKAKPGRDGIVIAMHEADFFEEVK